MLFENNYVQNGDDCLTVGSGAKNIHFRNSYCEGGHGVSIGSLGKGGDVADVQNVLCVVWANLLNEVVNRIWVLQNQDRERHHGTSMMLNLRVFWVMLMHPGAEKQSVWREVQELDWWQRSCTQVSDATIKWICVAEFFS